MSTLKRMLKSALDDRSPRFLLATIALGVVVSLIAGFAIGLKVQQSKGKTTKVAARTAVKKRKVTKKKKAAPAAAPLLVGTVLTSKPKQASVVNAANRRVTISIGPKTRVSLARASTAASIAVGTKVLFDPTATSASTAGEIVVLPATALVGYPVTAVSPGASMTLQSPQGASLVIKTGGAKVVLAGQAGRRRLAKRERVIALYYIVGHRHPATEVVVLPATSSFY